MKQNKRKKIRILKGMSKRKLLTLLLDAEIRCGQMALRQRSTARQLTEQLAKEPSYMESWTMSRYIATSAMFDLAKLRSCRVCTHRRTDYEDCKTCNYGDAIRRGFCPDRNCICRKCMDLPDSPMWGWRGPCPENGARIPLESVDLAMAEYMLRNAERAVMGRRKNEQNGGS